MVIAERLKSELLPVGSSDSGRVEGKEALHGAGAPGSSESPIKRPRGAGTAQTEPAGLVPGTPPLVSSQPMGPALAWT